MNKKKKQQNIDMKAPDVIETPASRETPESEREFQIEDELLAAADVPEELIEDIDAEEGISIKEGERIGLGLRSMQTQADILKEFVFEASCISLIGALMGVVIALGITPIIEKFSVRVELSISGAIISLLFGVITGTIFGFYPAYKASKLIPIVALNQE